MQVKMIETVDIYCVCANEANEIVKVRRLRVSKWGSNQYSHHIITI